MNQPGKRRIVVLGDPNKLSGLIKPGDQLIIPGQTHKHQPPESVGERKSFLGKVISYVKAEASLLLGSLGKDKYLDRIEKCKTCPALIPSSVPEELGWCSACGCGKSRRAELTVKARMPAATCPLKRW